MSEQQLLDCVYKDEDACEGGWYSDGWVTIRSTLGNQLPTEEVGAPPQSYYHTL